MPEIPSPGDRATVIAPSNIAFIKYWGARNLRRAVPVNPSISMSLSACVSRCTAVWLRGRGKHEVLLGDGHGNLAPAPEDFADRVRSHLRFLRRWSGVGGRFRIATENSFPSAAGIASSASGFAAVTLSVTRAVGRQLDLPTASSLARLSGSGSAARSVVGGFVEWPVGRSDEACYARVLAGAEHWDLRDVVAVVERGPKSVSSLAGHRRARTSPYFRTRQRRIAERLETVRCAIAERDFDRLAEVVEAEAIDLHCIAMTSQPAIFYWRPATLAVLAAVRTLRADGVSACFTIDAGANVHVICPAEAEPQVAAALEAMSEVEQVIRDGVGTGPIFDAEHLL